MRKLTLLFVLSFASLGFGQDYHYVYTDSLIYILNPAGTDTILIVKHPPTITDNHVLTYDSATNTASWEVASGAVANMAQNTIKMRVASGTGAPEDIDISAGLTLVTAAAGDFAIIEDATDGNLKRVDVSDFGGGGGLNNIVEDVTPQLGADLDVNTFEITSTNGIGLRIDSDNNTANSFFTIFGGNSTTELFRITETGVISWYRVNPPASYAMEFGVQGTTPIFSISSGVINLSAGALQVGGNAVPNSTNILDFFAETSLADPNADRIVFWDDSDTQHEYATLGNGISISVNDIAIDHDAADNFVANEHIDHTAVTFTAGTNLSGGGDLSANRTFNVDDAFLVNDAADEMLLADATTNVVTDILDLSHTGGTVAAGFGTGIRFDLEDAGGIEEQASIDVSLDVVTDAAEEASIIFRHNVAGTMQESMRIDGTAGFVGIGTSNPQEELHVVGEILLDHTATGSDEHAMEIHVDAAGSGDVQAVEIEYDTGPLSSGSVAAIILVDINQIDATGGDVIGLEILSTDGGADNVVGIKIGAEIAPLVQDSGVFVNPTLATNNTNTTDVPDMRDESTGTNTTIFASDNDFIIIGAAAAFTEIEFVIETGFGNPGIQPVFAFSTSGTNQFTNFTPTDGTDGFKNAGAFVVAWDADEVPSHVADDVTGTFNIRVTRTANPAGSVSLFYAKSAATRTFAIDENGNVRFLTYIFEGATDDAFEHTLNVIDPTADRLFNFPDDQLVAGDVLVASNASDLEYLNLATTEILIGDGSGVPTAAPLSGDATMTNGGVVTVISADLTTPGKIEIATGAETNTGTDPARAVSPDGLDDWTGSIQMTTLGTIITGVWTGTAVTYANLNFSNNIVAGDLADNSVDSGELVDGSIDESHLNITNAGTDNFVLTFNSAGSNFTWAADATGSGAWTDTDPVLLATSTRNVEIGDTGVALDAKVQIAGDADEVQLIVEGHSTQTDDIFIVQQDDETQVFTVSNAGNVGLAGTLDGVDIATRDAVELSKSFVIISPVATDDYPLWRVPHNITIKAIHILVEGGTNVIFGLDEADSDGNNSVAIDADITGTAGSNVNDDGSLTNPTVDSGDYLMLRITSISGTPTSMTVSFEYDVD